jgi:EthD domain
MYELVLCHRKKFGLGYHEFHNHWRQARSALVLELQPALGYTSYAQLHQTSRLNPLYLSILFTRSRLVTSLLASKKLPPAQPSSRMRWEERWDVTDEFLFPSKDAMVQALMSEAGTAAARRLVEDQTPRVRRTEVVTAEQFVAAPDPAPPLMDARTVFFLRRRPEMTREEMLGYWGDSHKKTVLSLQSDLKYRAYNQLHVRSAPELAAVVHRFEGAAAEEFDGVAELCFTSQWDLVKGIFRPVTELANLKLVKDETNFVDGQRSELVLGNHYRFRLG